VSYSCGIFETAGYLDNSYVDIQTTQNELEERITDHQRSLLVKYFREDIWNAIHRPSAKPSCKIFHRRYLERHSQITGKAFL